MNSARVVTDASWDDAILGQAGTTVIAFLARSSTPCQAFARALESVLRAAGTHVTLLCLEIEDNPLTARRFDISVMPTVVVFRGGALRDRLVGTRSAERLSDEVMPHLA